MTKCPICKENYLYNEQKLCDKCLFPEGRGAEIWRENELD